MARRSKVLCPWPFRPAATCTWATSATAAGAPARTPVRSCGSVLPATCRRESRKCAAAPGGFTIVFANPVDRAKAADAASYSVASFRRVPTPAYGGDDRDRRVETIRAVEVSDDARSATLVLDELRRICLRVPPAQPGRRRPVLSRRSVLHPAPPGSLRRRLPGTLMAFDLLIRGGTLIDGTGQPGRAADVAISGERIAAVGSLGDRAAEARRTIDAAGRVVAPGFIDVHTHADGWLLKTPNLLPKTSQGFTTEILMSDGISYAPVTRRTTGAIGSSTCARSTASCKTTTKTGGQSPITWPCSIAAPRRTSSPRFPTPTCACWPPAGDAGHSTTRRRTSSAARSNAPWTPAPSACRPGWTTSPSASPRPTSWSRPARRWLPGAAFT